MLSNQCDKSIRNPRRFSRVRLPDKYTQGNEVNSRRIEKKLAEWASLINTKRVLGVCRVDDLYRFIHAWVPSLYGELDENYWRERGYVLLDTDTDLSPELSPHEPGKAGEATEEEKCRQDSDEISELTRESWEVSGSILKLFSPNWPSTATILFSRYTLTRWTFV